MAAVTYDRATRRFGDTVAVSELSLEIEDGEFMVLVGPSGSGKTTALRLLAGLEPLSSGHIRIGERVVDEIAPRERDIAMVFQDYALYPQMSVRENLAFGLRMRNTGKGEIERRVSEAAAFLALEPLLDRKPRALSGGQRQRVALGRALVRDPQVFLMDEPLSNLDAKLRTQTRAEIRRLQRAVGTTTVYVTHDQVEAMTMGDRIAVMREGVLEQVGDPDTVYERPANTFVAGFIGSPAMSLAPFSLERRDSRLQLACGEVRLEVESAAELPAELLVGVRPEDTRLWGTEPELVGPLEGRVDYIESLGRETFIGVTAAGDARFVIETDGRVRAEPNELLRFGLRKTRLYAFDPGSERELGRL
ncbi:MAG: sn-glycerol-3-phosphate ABC transporter ATP-binding protein UgpC [Thermoleophilia bacterium]|nr:sn-glycerol-3-phosphate ABC transporter ATP-binding protein UgpC [Thermoleophilia bacterium]